MRILATGGADFIGSDMCHDLLMSGHEVTCAETLFFDYLHEYGIDIKVARIFNTCGPNAHPDGGRVVSSFIIKALRGEDITTYGEGRQTWLFCNVSDLVDGLLKLAVSPKGVASLINLGNPGEFTMMELAEKEIAKTGSGSKLTFLPLPPDDSQQRRPVIDRARDVLGWEPKVPLEDCLKLSIRHFERVA